MNKSDKNFEKALVIFIDILGSKNCNSFDALIEKNYLFHRELLGNKNQDRDYTAYQRHIYTFSDCAYIIYDFKMKSKQSLGELFDVALSNCEPIFMKFLSEGIIFRGGIAYGDTYYDESMNLFFGEAINMAYKYESEIAKFPRIVIDKVVASEIIQYTEYLNSQNNKRKKVRFDFRDHIGCFVKLDSDGCYFFNILNSLQHGRDYSLFTGKSNKKFIDDIIELCDKNIDVHRHEDSIRSKYEWLKKYAKQSANSNTEEVIINRKEFLWDKIFEEIKDKDDKMILLMMPNVGPRFTMEERSEIFKTVLDIVSRKTDE